MKTKRDTVKFIIRGVVIPFLILTLAMATVLTVYNRNLKKTAEARSYRYLSEISDTQKFILDNRYSYNFGALEIFASAIGGNRELRGNTAADLAEFLREACEKSNFDHMAFCDINGKITGDDGNVADCADREYIKSVIAGNACADFVMSNRIGGNPVFVFAVPVYDNGGGIEGAVIATRSVESVSRELSEGKDENCFVVICGADGEVLTVSDIENVSVEIGDDIYSHFRKTADVSVISADESANLDEYEYRGEKYYGMNLPFDEGDFMLFSVASDEYVSELTGMYGKQSIAIVGILTAMMLVAATVIIFLLHRRMKMLYRIEAEEKLKLREYHELQNKRAQNSDKIVGSFKMNLTKNTCKGGTGTEDNPGKRHYSGSIDGFVAVSSIWVHPSDRDRYIRMSSRENLIDSLANKIPSLQDDFLFRDADSGCKWIRVIIDLTHNPVTNDAEAVTYAIDINEEKRLEQIGRKLINDDFEVLGLIDVENGSVYGFAGTSERGGMITYKHPDESTDYDERVREDFPRVMLPEEYRDIEQSLLLHTVKEHLKTADRYSVSLRTAPRKDRESRYLRLEYSYLSDTMETIMLACEDISEIVESKTDILTGLYNSEGFHERVKEWISAHPGQKYRVLRYDIDNFKYINGTFGYETGNEILRNFGHFMRSNDGENSFSAHLNADHFARFCSEDSASPDELYEKFGIYFRKYKFDFPLSVHLGVYDLCEPECDSFAISYKALLALQSIKGDYSTHIAYYKPGLMNKMKEQQELLGEVQSAIEEDRFELRFQPLIDYSDGSLIGAEALIRWNHPTKGMIPPGMFIPLLERGNLITNVDKIVWRKSCEFMRGMLDRGIAIPISVNVSRKDIFDPGLCDFMLGLVKHYDIEPALLRLEITESAYSDNPDQLLRTVSEFRKAGFVVEMDDFGSGFSSLNALKDMSIDILKLDMKFLADSDGNEKGDNILSSVIKMAHSIGMRVIAEGVETKKQADHLLSLDCKFMQGYYFGKPMTEEDFEEYIRERSNT